MENFGRMERVGEVIGKFSESSFVNAETTAHTTSSAPSSPLRSTSVTSTPFSSTPGDLSRAVSPQEHSVPPQEHSVPAQNNVHAESSPIINEEEAAIGEKSSSEVATSDLCSLAASDLDELWSESCKQIQDVVESQVYAAWLRSLRLTALQLPSKFDGEAVATVSAPNKFCSDHVQRNYSELLRSVLCKLLFAQVRLVFKVAAAPAEQPARETAANTALQNNATAAKQSHGKSSDGNGAGTAKTVDARSLAQKTGPKERTKERNGQAVDDSNLNPKYNFSNFVVGSCNQLAHAVGLKVSESLGSIYNPLFVYGGVGLGKTHLANAIGNASRRRSKKVLLVSSETFVSELIASLRSSRMDQFKSKFRSLDLLIIDDIQFIIGKERTQEEFFHTFNDLHNRHKQIIITCDKVPQELVGLEERLRTRFASGLSVDLQAPDFETRVAILNKKAEAEGVVVPDEVARCLAERINTNVRELEGALNRLKALSSLQKTEINRRLAEEVLESLSPIKVVEVTTELIQRTVAEKFNVSVHDLLGKRRTQNIALARQVAMYLCRRLTALSYPEIGAFFGGRDHSTVIHAFKSISERISGDPEFASEVSGIERRIRA
jgi:chromosomal replication initiator protein